MTHGEAYIKQFRELLGADELRHNIKEALELVSSTEDVDILREVEKRKNESFNDKKKIKNLRSVVEKERELTQDILVKQIGRFPKLQSEFDRCITNVDKLKVVTKGIDDLFKEQKRDCSLIAGHQAVLHAKNKENDTVRAENTGLEILCQKRFEEIKALADMYEKEKDRTRRLEDEVALLKKKLGEK